MKEKKKEEIRLVSNNLIFILETVSSGFFNFRKLSVQN